MATGTMCAATAAAEPLDEPPGVCSRVERVAGLAGRVGRELGGHRLAEDDRAGRAQALDHRGIVVGRAAGVQHGAVLGRHVGGVDDVLDADRQAVQRAGGVALARTRSTLRACSSARFSSTKAQACTALVVGADAREAARHELLGAGAPFAERGQRLGRAERGDVDEIVAFMGAPGRQLP